MADQSLHQPGHAGGAHAAHHVHVIPLKVYIGVWLALMFLTALTVAVSFVHIGFLNVPIALSIAMIKATLVALIFMHLYYDEKFNLIVLLSGLVFVAIFFAFTLIDPLTRGEVNADEGYFLVPEMPRAGVDVQPLAADGLTTGGHGEEDTHGAAGAMIDTHQPGAEPAAVGGDASVPAEELSGEPAHP
ncbi:MAG TPA: cytochrome C oxidase subunit IV family protein [Candidatus Sumerlaeota bacterium]|nr:cytochrome C oxidase subunit IV family protein [Candidatus Sumerlaeota bacterium]